MEGGSVPSDDWLKLGGLKGFVDGSLGSHTAAMFEPFDDDPENRGLIVNSQEDLYTWISGADSSGLQPVIHAIGDRAISELLDIFQRVQTENGPRDRRFRIEHAQHIKPDEYTRFADLKIVASMQPYHAIDDGRWAEKVIGSRIASTYAFRSLMDAGALVAFGSDWFVAPAIPLEGIYAATTRHTLDGKNPSGWVPDQIISTEQALAAYTRNAAFAGFDEDCKGVIKPGYLADLVVLDRDPLSLPPEQTRELSVIATIVGGKVVYSSVDIPNL